MLPMEAEWLNAAKQFNEKALAQIYEAYSPELFRYAYRLLGSEQAAEDVVGETFHRFLRAIQGGGGPNKHLRAYLYRVAHNLVIDRHRRNPTPSVDLENIENNAASNLSPEEEASQALAAEDVRKKLWQLTDDQRQVLILKYYQGLSNAEAAEAIGKPAGAVKALQHRAINSLRRMMNREEMRPGTGQEGTS